MVNERLQRKDSTRPMPTTLIALVLLMVLSEHALCTSRTFTVDYDQGTFLKDGKPFNYVSGSIHYARVHPDKWYDRLYKMKYAGLDAVQTYVPWNFHEPEEGVLDFEGAHDLEKFIEMAHDLGLMIILRPGPYICAEWEFGGFPYWLIKQNASIALRSSDPAYLKAVSAWFSILMPKIRPYLYSNGGPVISVQIENEYGSFAACDRNYMNFLWNLHKELLIDDVVYFTTDGDATYYLRCGVLPGTLSTVDFGVGSAKDGYASLNAWNTSFRGPYVNSEYYVGWIDLWGRPHSLVSPWDAAKTLDEALGMKANINIYMFHGGTNFAFHSGAPTDTPYSPVPTSYDFDAVLNEAGDMTFKYWLLRNTIGKYKPLPVMDEPRNSTKIAYGKVNVTLQGPIHQCAPMLASKGGSQAFTNAYPLRMEVMNMSSGYTLYRHILASDTIQGNLSVPGIRDRGYVTINDDYVGILYRDEPTSLHIEAQAGDTINILVENMGRVGAGPGIDRNAKGIISNVTIDGLIVTNWTMFPVDTSLFQICKIIREQQNATPPLSFTPSAYGGTFIVTQPADAFLRLDGWFKGHILINGFNIGRYWPIKGPQITLFVPSAILVTGQNNIVVTELERLPNGIDSSYQVEFVDVPDINSLPGLRDGSKLWFSRENPS